MTKAGPVTTRSLLQMKQSGRKITAVTAYDYPSARAADAADIDFILVGDSLGMVVLGYDSTLPVTMDDMLHHTRAASRGVRRAFLVGDMPFMSYQAGEDQALANAGRFLQEAGAHAVKLEGGRHIAPLVRRAVQAGIPVCGHLGFTPQSVHQLGGARVQAREAAEAAALMEDAFALQEAGIFCLVLELVPFEVAAAVSRRLRIPTLGIGSGPGCDGQILVYHDMLGLYDKFVPKHTRQYATLAQAAQQGLERYVAEVRAVGFPGPEHGRCLGDKAAAAVEAVESVPAPE